ncbi:proline-rich transmembrane protein 3 [Osmerus eperlanus]|uniref:proline-rich transmembrane protein 3 n=1 Tax=Osmerus eperlanus TaxID=29151 RepID=UPI002E13FE70
MATVSLFSFTLLFCSSLHLSPGQVIISSSSSSLEPPTSPSSKPTNQTSENLSSYPPRGRTDVPIKVFSRIWPTRTGVGGMVSSPPLTLSTTHTFSSSPAPKLSSRPDQTGIQTETATKVTPSSSTIASDHTRHSNGIPSAGTEPFTVNRADDGPVPKGGEDDWQVTGSGSEPYPTITGVEEELRAGLTTSNAEMAQFKPQAQTAFSEDPSSKMADILLSPTISLTEQPSLSNLTPANRNISTAPPKVTPMSIVTQTTVRVRLLTQLTANNTTPLDQPTERLATTVTSPTARDTTPVTTTQTAAPQRTTSSTTHKPTTTPQPERMATSQQAKTTELRRTAITTGAPPLLTTPTLQIGRGRFGSTDQSGPPQQNRSVRLGRPRTPPSSNPSTSPGSSPFLNGTSLHWDDLSRTLAFAWDLHVYGSAGLFLLLLAGAALGLGLSPSMDCSHRGALALANALLLLAAAVRAALFLIDPYGTRRLLPRPAVTALYNLALPLLVWAQAALALLAMRGAGLSLLPEALESAPLAAVLAVLQCTLLLAADLLSPALSPAVPVTLQCLSLGWGLVICLGFLCYVFPRLGCPPVPRPGGSEEPSGKAWAGGRRTGLVLSRVLAVCGLLGALCCGLHVHATLWLYGLLGEWRRFGWGWWLVHFWARLLELAWGFSLLLLASWVFWRPRGSQGRGEGAGGEGRAGGDLPSPGQSSGSTQRHTCWSKIVQSLRGKPCRKSESNGVVGGGGGVGGGGPGELPNNWAGQDRPGADISKSLIRNQNPEQPPPQPRNVKDSNCGRNQRGRSADRGVSDGSTGSLLRLQALGRPQRSLCGSLEREKESGLSLYEFDLRPPSPIDLSRSIDEALHREHLLRGGSLFQPLCPPSPSPSPCSGGSQGPWLRRNSDPQLVSDSSDDHSARTESSMPLGGSVMSSVPSRQVTAPPTPSHQGHRWAGDGGGSVPSSVSCPVSLRPSRTSTGHLGDEVGDDTRPFLTPDSERERGRAGREAGAGRSYLEVSRQEDSASVSSEIIDL